MIRVRCMGHIKSSLGSDFVELQESDLTASELVQKLRERAIEKEPGFNAYNTLALVGHGEAFVPATSGRKISSGDEVVLIPFSHGG